MKKSHSDMGEYTLSITYHTETDLDKTIYDCCQKQALSLIRTTVLSEQLSAP